MSEILVEETMGWDELEHPDDSPAELPEVPLVDVGGQFAINQRRVELEETKARYGVSLHTLAAFNRLVQAYADAGRRIDELDYYEPDEARRFFRHVMQGANGHAFWNGARDGFFMNSGSRRKPLLWWWEHLYGSRIDRHRLTCGVENCINPRHAIQLPKGAPRIYPDHVILGALQLWAIRHGKPPSSRLWDGHPTHIIIKRRFGNWANALRAAGLEPITRCQATTAQDCIDGVRFVRDLIGHWPSYDEYRGAKVELRAHELPLSPTTVRRHFGTWANALEAAQAEG